MRVARRLILSGTLLAVLSLAAWDIFCVVTGFRGLVYTSDGFHYYSFLRNLVQYGSWFEGPTMEYLMGVHAYVSLIALAPLVAIFPTPVVLGVVSVATHYLSATLAFFIAKRLRLPMLVSAAVALIYLVTPYVLSTKLGTQLMFQPDFLAVPLVLGMVLALVHGRWILGSVLLALVILTKEEWILQAPLILGFVFISGAIPFSRPLRRMVLPLCASYVSAAVVSLGVLLLVRGSNTKSHLPLGPETPFLLPQLEGLKGIALTGIENWGLFGLAAMVLLIVSRRRRSAVLLVAFVVLLVFRYTLNYVIYANPAGSPWSTHAFISPLCVLLVIFLLESVRMRKVILAAFVFVLAGSLTVVINLRGGDLLLSTVVGAVSRQTDTVGYASSATQQRLANVLDRFRVETESLSRQGGYFIVDENLMGPFMSMSHVATEWAISQPDFENILGGARFVVISAASPLPPETLIDAGFRRIDWDPESGLALYAN